MLPAERSKNGVPLVRPLSKAALDAVQAQDRIEGCPYVFTAKGQRPLNDYVRGKRKTFGGSVYCWGLRKMTRKPNRGSKHSNRVFET